MSTEADFSTLSLEERFAHGVWKARLGAYEEYGKQFEGSRNENDPCFADFNARPDLLKRFIIDANVVAQETALLAFTKFLKYGGTPNNVSRLRQIGVVESIVDKGLSSSRTKTKEYSIESILLLIELSHEPNGIVEDLFPSLLKRLPKLVAGVVTCLHSIISNYGCKSVILPKPIITHLAKLFAHADKNVRAETTKLTVELYKWMGQALEMVLFPELKPVQQKDLAKLFEGIKGTTTEQLRFTRKEQEQREVEAEAAAPSDDDIEMADAAEANGGAVVDPYEFIDPVEVLSKLPTDLNSRIDSTKWKDRKEVLDEVYLVLSKAIKIKANDDYGHLVRIFAKCMKDANVQVVQLAANCCEFLVKGIGKEFHKYRTAILAPMIDRLKEKKASVATALSDALDSIFSVSSFADVLEEIFIGMNNKTPQTKIATTSYLQRCLSNSKVAPTASEIDTIMQVGVKLLSESQEPIRQASTEMIGTLMKITGERELNSFLDKIDDNRKAKVFAFYETVSVNSKFGKPVPKKQPPPASGTTRKVKPAAASSTIPAKRGASSPVKREEAKVSTFGRGLTGRSLASNVTPVLPPTPARLPPVELISSAEKEELLALRQEKKQWLEQQQKDLHLNEHLQDENVLLTQELSQMHASTEFIKKDHSTAMLMIKQKETQILRLNSDLESAKLKTRDLEQAIQIMQLKQNQQPQPQLQHQQQLQYNQASPYRVSSPQTNQNTFKTPEQRSSKLSPGELSSHVDRLSIGNEFRENGLTFNRYASPQGQQQDLASYSAVEPATEDSWKRAAEVTSQLKARIEKMKERSRNSTLNM